MQRIFSSIALMLLALCAFSTPVMAEDDEIWWGAAEREAERDGYKLIDTKGVAALLSRHTDAILVDARADYEHEGGHIPGTVNMEFDLGDRTDLSPAKREAFTSLLGPDRSRQIVLYCRSFR